MKIMFDYFFYQTDTNGFVNFLMIYLNITVVIAFTTLIIKNLRFYKFCRAQGQKMKEIISKARYETNILEQKQSSGGVL